MTPNFDADIQWINDLSNVINMGIKSAPRGMGIYELIGYTSHVKMWNPIIFNPNRKLGYRFMAAEAAWILSGRDDVKSISPYSKDISNFSDDGEVFFGAYGPKIVNQIRYVIDTLVGDPDSRQAVITIWRENPKKSKDIPCTVSLQWLVRNGEIHCVANMRSSDLWLGHPYDIFNFSAVSFYIMLHLNMIHGMNLKLGNLILHAGSKHIYERNVERISDLLTNVNKNGIEPVERTPVFEQSRYNSPDQFILNLWDCANEPHGALLLK